MGRTERTCRVCVRQILRNSQNRVKSLSKIKERPLCGKTCRNCIQDMFFPLPPGPTSMNLSSMVKALKSCSKTATPRMSRDICPNIFSMFALSPCTPRHTVMHPHAVVCAASGISHLVPVPAQMVHRTVYVHEEQLVPVQHHMVQRPSSIKNNSGVIQTYGKPVEK